MPTPTAHNKARKVLRSNSATIQETVIAMKSETEPNAKIILEHMARDMIGMSKAIAHMYGVTLDKQCMPVNERPCTWALN